MGEGISDYTRFTVDLRRHMWMAGVEPELRRLIWQIAVMGKYISAKINESNRKLAGSQNVSGEEQLEGEGYKLRYSGGFVPDINQVLIKKGGVFTYHALKKSPKGKLRLLFELQPMAYIIEQAGGMATNGREDILSFKVEELHQRSPIYIGSRFEVEKARAFLTAA